MKVRATAPGKLVVLGEYAVLAGAPALVLAVDRRCRVDLGPSDDERCQLRIRAPESREVTFSVGATSARCAARFGPPPGRRPDSTARLRTLLKTAAQIRIRCQAFERNRQKSAELNTDMWINAPAHAPWTPPSRTTPK